LIGGKSGRVVTLKKEDMFISHQKKPDKATLWERYVQGDKAAFGELYTFYHKSLTAFCLGRLKSRELAENAASETLVKLLQYPKPSEIENFESWLFTVAKNECHTQWATTERRRVLLENNYEVKHDHKPEVEQKFSIENIDQIIRDNLEEMDYKIWQLYQQGYDNGEVAEILGLHEKTVANRKSAARSQLKLILKKYSSNGKSL
jgi:RNA polymerase sigma factor (sigma-70 family)